MSLWVWIVLVWVATSPIAALVVLRLMRANMGATPLARIVKLSPPADAHLRNARGEGLPPVGT